MDMPVWSIIPAMFLITLGYLGLSTFNYGWVYTPQDFIGGNLAVMFGVGIYYLGATIYGGVKKDGS